MTDSKLDIAVEIGGYCNSPSDVCARASAEIWRLRSELHSIRDTTIEDCARVAEETARRRREGEASRGFTPESATSTANTYWCEEIADAIRALKDKNPREEK